MTQKRSEFREQVFERDNYNCTVPWCDGDSVDAHHIIERDCWDNGGYIPGNGASVCEKHHKYAERDLIPPQAFWFWIGLEPVTPNGMSMNIDKWGNELQSPEDTRENTVFRETIKYPSTRHLPFSNIGDKDDTAHETVEPFVGVPLVITEKMDGSNAMLLKDEENPVRARNGKHAKHKSFSLLKSLYWEKNLYEIIPDNIQVFGEWTFAKHSIHYGCSCDDECEDVGPSLLERVSVDNISDERMAYFQIFGVYNVEYNMWLSWPGTKEVAAELGFPTAPVLREAPSDDTETYRNRNELYDDVYSYAKQVVDSGSEGVVIHSKFPYHFAQIDIRLGKYVRRNHVQENEKHWSKRPVVENNL